RFLPGRCVPRHRRVVGACTHRLRLAFGLQWPAQKTQPEAQRHDARCRHNTALKSSSKCFLYISMPALAMSWYVWLLHAGLCLCFFLSERGPQRGSGEEIPALVCLSGGKNG
ncbi:hypothetical protein XENOCAPTIV_001134, partial [Xenoophorus captivus]